MRKNVNLISKLGDHGTSSLFSGERVSKSSLRIETLGDLDELGAVLGVARCYVQKERIKKELLDLQRKLFVLGSELATTDDTPLSRRVDDAFLEEFEQTVQALQDVTRIKEGFSLSGDSIPAAYLNHARTVARRVERHAVNLFEQKELQNQNILAFLNRLSVYLYIMARFEDPNPTMLKP